MQRFVYMLCLLGILNYQEVKAKPNNTIYVNAAVQSNGDGTSWSTAFNNLQDALDAVLPDDEIWVAAGTYTPTQAYDDSTYEYDVAFVLRTDNINIYGGFPTTGNPTMRNRNWVENKTILSGDIDYDDTDQEIIGYNATHVIINIAKDVLLDGFTITRGSAANIRDYESGNTISYVDGYEIDKQHGGGLVNAASSKLILKNSIVKANFAYYGGGIANETGSSSEFVNVLICGNGSNYQGGGIYNSGTNATFTNVTISGNWAYLGGGVYNDGSAANFFNTIITGNNSEDVYGSGQIDYSYSLIDGKFYRNEGPERWMLNPEEVFRNWIPSGNTLSVFEDYSLLPDCFAIDRGNNDFIIEATDLHGIPRIMNGVVDLGAFEYYSTSHIEVSVSGVSTPDRDKLEIILYKSDGTVLNKITNNTIFDNVNPGEYAISVSYPGYIMSYCNRDGKHAPTWKDASPIVIEGDGQYVVVSVTLVSEQSLASGTITISGVLGYDDDIFGLSKIRPMTSLNGNVSLSSTSTLKSDEYVLVKTIQTTDGHYSFTDLPKGYYRITADIAGYDPGTVDIHVVEGMKTVNFIVKTDTKTIISESETLTEAPSWQAKNIKVYPNPAVDVLHVSGLEDVYSVKIINILGQLLYSATGSSPELLLNVGHLPSGMYFLRIESNQKATTHKIIKQ